jgi:hypothetical protein
MDAAPVRPNDRARWRCVKCGRFFLYRRGLSRHLRQTHDNKEGGFVKYDSRVDTYQHIDQVRKYLGQFVRDLLTRSAIHDASKLEPPELEAFDTYTPKLSKTAYGTSEYERYRHAMGEALEHHYAMNRHHPEHHERGIAGMTLTDLIEMLADWKAASERHGGHRPPMPAAPGRSDAPEYDSDLVRSIGLNQERFGYGDELRAILENTAVEMWGAVPE